MAAPPHPRARSRTVGVAAANSARTAAAVIAASLALGACAGAGPAGGAPSRPPAGLTADLEQSRHFSNQRKIEVILRNDGSEPVTVEQLQLRSPRFTEVPPTSKDSELAPGRRIDFPIDYGQALCDERQTSASQAAASIQLRVGDGPSRQVVLPVSHPSALLDKLHRDECGQRAVAEAADVAFGDDWSVAADDALIGSIVLRSKSPGRSVELVGAAGTVIFNLQAEPEGEAPLAQLTPDQLSAEAPVVITASRCEPHAVAESKKTFLFPVWVSLDGEPAVYQTIEPTGQGRELLDELLQRCIEREIG